ncbi:hypothetical protein PF005_g21896 [Phytophthora fragariae]|uniref:Uncharacterized protein n=1 Tax=Phytophthora fragariae TaxID=53985 RepID=A0A6A3QTX6_9STRA|nr:hypothetical protein PF003_g2120 [Phytophthora fragariae]KAE8927060.1 hypothetical protein PF009_g22760 [Phytophthora fragariae]KAE8984790.1 hypothetical protein PF011_g20646 [Phytophthora fragariae]KAE9083411.1 hypothetical protein PF007_g21907 [Phytophthora fragariae]KAE9083761.1 hypothetical protein PF010_g21092 [Phytophthora fragariae]
MAALPIRIETYIEGPYRFSSLPLAASVHRGPVHESEEHSQRPFELQEPVVTDVEVQSLSAVQNAMPDTAVAGLSSSQSSMLSSIQSLFRCVKGSQPVAMSPSVPPLRSIAPQRWPESGLSHTARASRRIQGRFHLKS